MLLKKVAFMTLGCKVNQYETQLLRELFAQHGYQEVAAHEKPDYYIVNTCTVTSKSDQKCRKMLRRLKKQNPAARIVVTGCYAQRDPQSLHAMPEVDLVVGNAAKLELAKLVAQLPPQQSCPSPLTGKPQVPIQHSIKGFKGHTRIFVKIQDGCNLGCSYCIIPRVRGPIRSKPPHLVCHEVAQLLHQGFQEIVLTGIHLGAYGQDQKGRWNLAQLVRELCQLQGLTRLRLSSLECHEVSEELLDLWAVTPQLVPHIHLPLQAGSDPILARMKRHYTVAEFLQRCDQIRQKLDRPAITTDLIVGFPGESAQHFQETMATCQRAGFAKIHVFPYADRPGAPAASFYPKVPSAVQKERVKAALQLSTQLAQAYQQQFLHTCMSVLVEGRAATPGMLSGLTDRYFRVIFQGPANLQQRLVTVKLEKVSKQAVHGRLVASKCRAKLNCQQQQQ